MEHRVNLNSFYLTMIILLLVGLCSTSCVSTKPANSIKKAENRIIKYNIGTKNQLERYPSLIKKANKIIVKDTVKIPMDSVSFTATLIQLDSLEKLTEKNIKLLSYRGFIIDSLLNVPLNEFPKECDEIVKELQFRLRLVSQNFKTQTKESTEWFNKYMKVVSTENTGFYEDDKFKVDYFYKYGDIQISPKVKDKFIIIDKEEYTYEVDIRKNFWQDLKFYPFLLILISLFYFFGDIIFGFIKKTLPLLRKLLIKI